jgi:hypothetical protein
LAFLSDTYLISSKASLEGRNFCDTMPEVEILDPIDLAHPYCDLTKIPEYDSCWGLNHPTEPEAWRETSRRFACPYCRGASVTNWDGMVIHILQWHFRKNDFPRCIHCRTQPRFSSMEVLESHMRKNHPLKPCVSSSKPLAAEDAENLIPLPINMKNSKFQPSQLPVYRKEQSMGLPKQILMGFPMDMGNENGFARFAAELWRNDFR